MVDDPGSSFKKGVGIPCSWVLIVIPAQAGIHLALD